MLYLALEDPPRFTHVDPFEDTERPYHQTGPGKLRGFTHVDPFEDTERTTRQSWDLVHASFTHVDPFEDTERLTNSPNYNTSKKVSPTSIRSRILKERFVHVVLTEALLVSPTSIRSRILKASALANASPREVFRFTHVDPFEDTERQ